MYLGAVVVRMSSGKHARQTTVKLRTAECVFIVTICDGKAVVAHTRGRFWHECRSDPLPFSLWLHR